MRLGDFLSAQAAGTELYWLGQAPGEHAATSAIRPHRGTTGPQVPVLHISDDLTDDHFQRLGELPEGSRAVILADVLPVDEVAVSIADALASHRWQLLHVVLLEDAASISAHSGISAQRVEKPLAGDDAPADLTTLNRTLLPGSSDASAGRAVLRNELARIVSALDQSHRQADEQAVRLAAAEARIFAMSSSSRWLIGTAAVDVVKNPVRGSREALKALRARWQARNRPTPDGSAPKQQSTGRWLDFNTSLPQPPSRRALPVSELHLSLPSTYYVARLLSQKGVAGYEPAMLAWFLALCERAKPGAVWDVGANLGVYALLARAYTDREVIGFEPTPDIAGWGRRLATDNGLDYALEQFAAGDSVGTATLYLSNATDSSNSLSAGFRPSTRQVEVLVEPLDRYAARTRSEPAILKIDTETTEHLVLRGAQHVIANTRPWIFCEVLQGRAPESQLTDIMSAHGYDFYRLDGSFPLAKRDTVVGNPTFMNYLFAPEVIDDELTADAQAWAEVLQGRRKPR